jgi:ABC-type amino acid transport substrate-binding protein
MGAIVVGYLDPFRPFAWSEGGAHRGSFLDALRVQATARGVALSFRPGTLAGLPEALAAGEIDAIAAKAVTPGRAGAFAFSRPLARSGAALFAPAGRVAPGLEDAGAARVATPAEGPLAALLPQLAPGVAVVAVADYAAALAAVLAGAADLAALNADAGAEAAAARHPGRFAPPGPRFAELDLALAVRPGDPGRVLERLGL